MSLCLCGFPPQLPPTVQKRGVTVNLNVLQVWVRAVVCVCMSAPTTLHGISCGRSRIIHNPLNVTVLSFNL